MRVHNRRRSHDAPLSQRELDDVPAQLEALNLQLRTCWLPLLLAPYLDAQEAAISFEHVNVVPMHREVVLRDQTVVVQDGIIVKLGPADGIEVPEDSARVDGQGMYLMPGLSDMHVHLTHPAELVLYVTSGVTTVRNMWGGPDTLALREEIRSGETLGPRIFTTGPIMDGEDPKWRGSPVLTDVQAASKVVEEHQETGYDAVKVYDGLSREVYEALLTRARALELPVVGHVPDDVGLRAAIEQGQSSIEHLDGYLEADPAELEELARLSAESGTWNCVTLVVHDLPWRGLDPFRSYSIAPTFFLLPPSVLARWDPKTDARYGGITEMTAELWDAHEERMGKLHAIVRMLHEAGAPLLLGTDAPNPFVVPGRSIYEELDQLVTAGLSAYEALRAGTVDAARYLGTDHVAGTVAVGKAADLLLVRGNPLERVKAVSQLEGVMLAGRWLPKQELDRLLEETIASYAPPQDWFEGMPAVQGDSPVQYDVFWNQTQIAAERIGRATVDGNLVVVHEQSVLRDQFQDKRISALRTAHGSRGLTVSVWSNGRRGMVEMASEGETLALRGTLPSGQEIEVRQPLGENDLVGTGILPHALRFASGLSGLEIGETTSIELRTPEFEEVFEASRTTVEITRMVDRIHGTAGRHIEVHAFSLRLTTGQYTTPAILTVDADGLPVTLELIFQQGRKIFRRVE